MLNGEAANMIYFDLYPIEKIDVPKMPEGYDKTVPSAALFSTRPWPNFGVTHEQAVLSNLATRDLEPAYARRDACVT